MGISVVGVQATPGSGSVTAISLILLSGSLAPANPP